jgi:hypothetical protein
MKITGEQLVEVANELNKLLFDPEDPQINTEIGDEEELKAQILEAAELIQPDDDISEKTEGVLAQLQVKDEGTAEAKEEEATKEEATKEEKTEMTEEDMVRLIKSAERSKDVKELIKENDRFKGLRDGLAKGIYRVAGGFKKLQEEMLEILEIVQAAPTERKKEKKREKKKEKTETVKKDTYGFKMDSIKHLVAKMIEEAGDAGVTVKQIKEAKWNIRKDSYKTYWMELIDKGFAEIDAKGTIFLKK